MQRPTLNVYATRQQQLVMAYAAELELEVDRLRRRDRFLQEAARNHNRGILALCQDDGAMQGPVDALMSVQKACNDFRELLSDVDEPAGYHPAFDQVIAIAVRPLTEQVFRWQQRLNGATNAVLQLDLQCDHINWFPARLRHILDNLISHSLRHRDPTREVVHVDLALRVLDRGYELRLADNGLGMPFDQAASITELFHRAAPIRAAGLGVGLAVVRLLVEQCCGTFTVGSNESSGAKVTILLPHYELDDHVE